MQDGSSILQHAEPPAVTFIQIGQTQVSQEGVIAPVTDVQVQPSASQGGCMQYRAAPSDIIMKRYQLAGFIDRGSFGAVYKATDLYTGSVVAVKVFHKGQSPHRATSTEENVYTKLVAGCSPHTRLFAEVMGSGTHDGHHCLVLELCGPSLLQLLSSKKLLPLPRRHVQEIAFQLLQGVAYLHSLGLIHTDLKPDNIAIKNPGVVSVRYFDPIRGFRRCHQLVSTQIRILDTGGVVQEIEDGLEGNVGTINYRAPEISLGLPYDHAVDIFALGCVLAEVHLGRQLFSCDISSSREHIAHVERICGPFPLDFAEDVEETESSMFRIDGGVASVNYPGEEFNAEKHAEPLRRLLRAKPIASRVHDIGLANLLRRLLAPDPSKRMELNQALRHAYFDDLASRRR